MFAKCRLGTRAALFGLLGCNAHVLPVRAQEDQAQAGTPAAIPLDANLVFQRVIVGADGVVRNAPPDAVSTAGNGDRLIYSNTLGLHTTNLPSNQPVSDDIATTAPNGCSLTRYRFKVQGKVLPGGAEGPYTVTYGLYTTCPLAVGSNNATRDLVRISGTEGVIAFPDDAPRLIEHVVSAETPVALPTNVYLSLRFNRSNCGTVVGAPAMIGYSGDIWDFPGFPCNGFLGGFPELPHASFWAEFFGANCADAFVAYKANRHSGGTATPGANIQAVDDIKLAVNNCQMVGYEVAVRGVGFYSFEIRRTCEGAAIDGTQRTFSVSASTVPLLQVARFNFDPPITLGDDQLYLGFKSSSNTGGAVVAGIEPIIGSSGPDIFTQTTANGCEPVLPTQGVYGAINLAITCAGQLPTGACCDPYLTECAGGADAGKRCLANSDCASPGTCEAVCRETTELNCPRPLDQDSQWAAAQECGPDAFGGHVCGIAACCYQNEYGLTCENLTQSECNSKSPVNRHWQFGQYCGEGSQACSYTDYCLGTPGSCFIAHDTPGCNDPSCCGEICWRGSAEAFCCEVAWDSACVALAERCCTGAPPIPDQCAVEYPDWCSGEALTIPVPGSQAVDNRSATTDTLEPRFCCNNGTGFCLGESDDGAKCVVGTDCISGVCSELVPQPWAQGLGTIWFKFVPPAGVTSVGISTCNSNSPALDSILQVFTATDRSSAQAACNSLVPIGCNDDAANCGSTGRNSRLCLHDLVPGQTYYIELAAKTPNRLGQYIVTLSTNCTGTTPSCPYCPAGMMNFVDPPDGVVDARRPHPPGNPQTLEGIQTIVATGPAGATPECWSVCESPGVDAAIEIASINEGPYGTYTIQFDRPITAGSVTFLKYQDDQSSATIGRFIAHPGNVNGDLIAFPFDIISLIDHLNGITPVPWGGYSGDLDHSGVIAPADILTLIDGLNGTSGYQPWWGTALPKASECP